MMPIRERRFCLVMIAVIAILLPQLISADMIPLGQKNTEHCIRIENMDEYPDYSFFYVSFMGGDVYGSGVIREGECIRFYKHTRAKIYAFDMEGQEWPGGHEKGRTHLLRRLLITNTSWFMSHSAASEEYIHYDSTIPFYSPVTKREAIHTITSIDGADNTIRMEKRTERSINPFMFIVYAVAFLITLIAEAIIIWLYLRKNLGMGMSGAVKYSFLLNIVSYPIAVLFYTGLYSSLLIAEILVFAVEALMLWLILKTGPRDSVLTSFTANLLTAFLGIVMYVLILFA
ncbi:MAG: hypothetical protein R6U32_00105 [Candidatus Woesearchaeota archaeon]